MRSLSNKTNLSTTESKNAGDVLFRRLEPVQEVWTPAGIVQPSIESERVFQTALGVLYEGVKTRLLSKQKKSEVLTMRPLIHEG